MLSLRAMNVSFSELCYCKRWQWKILTTDTKALKGNYSTPIEFPAFPWTCWTQEVAQPDAVSLIQAWLCSTSQKHLFSLYPDGGNMDRHRWPTDQRGYRRATTCCLLQALGQLIPFNLSEHSLWPPTQPYFSVLSDPLVFVQYPSLWASSILFLSHKSSRILVLEHL